jgi:hypothetical protein
MYIKHNNVLVGRVRRIGNNNYVLTLHWKGIDISGSADVLTKYLEIYYPNYTFDLRLPRNDEKCLT